LKKETLKKLELDNMHTYASTFPRQAMVHFISKYYAGLLKAVVRKTSKKMGSLKYGERE
jgi:hypothetical protein